MVFATLDAQIFAGGSVRQVSLLYSSLVVLLDLFSLITTTIKYGMYKREGKILVFSSYLGCTRAGV
jgi:hypothetical protein